MTTTCILSGPRTLVVLLELIAVLPNYHNKTSSDWQKYGLPRTGNGWRRGRGERRGERLGTLIHSGQKGRIHCIIHSCLWIQNSGRLGSRNHNNGAIEGFLCMCETSKGCLINVARLRVVYAWFGIFQSLGLTNKIGKIGHFCNLVALILDAWAQSGRATLIKGQRDGYVCGGAWMRKSHAPIRNRIVRLLVLCRTPKRAFQRWRITQFIMTCIITIAKLVKGIATVLRVASTIGTTKGRVRTIWWCALLASFCWFR